MAVSELLVWVDCEMTGLDLTADALSRWPRWSPTPSSTSSVTGSTW